MIPKGKSLPYVPPNAPVQQQIAALNRVIDIINSFQNSITFSDSQSRRMIIGYQRDGWGPGKDFGIKISQPGVDVYSASDEELLFKMDIETWYFYDPNYGTNVMQLGRLPNNKYGYVVAKEGSNVDDGYTE